MSDVVGFFNEWHADLARTVRVKVRPLGPVQRAGQKKRIAWCRDGYEAVCSECGDLEVPGFAAAGRAGNLSTVMSEFRRHIERKHR